VAQQRWQLAGLEPIPSQHLPTSAPGNLPAFNTAVKQGWFVLLNALIHTSYAFKIALQKTE